MVSRCLSYLPVCVTVDYRLPQSFASVYPGSDVSMNFTVPPHSAWLSYTPRLLTSPAYGGERSDGDVHNGFLAEKDENLAVAPE